MAHFSCVILAIYSLSLLPSSLDLKKPLWKPNYSLQKHPAATEYCREFVEVKLSLLFAVLTWKRAWSLVYIIVIEILIIIILLVVRMMNFIPVIKILNTTTKGFESCSDSCRLLKKKNYYPSGQQNTHNKFIFFINHILPVLHPYCYYPWKI